MCGPRFTTDRIELSGIDYPRPIRDARTRGSPLTELSPSACWAKEIQGKGNVDFASFS
jgi:hypothetical protein